MELIKLLNRHYCRIVLLIFSSICISLAYPNKPRDVRPNQTLQRDHRQQRPSLTTDNIITAENLQNFIQSVLEEKLNLTERKLDKKCLTRIQGLNHSLSHMEKLLNHHNEEFKLNDERLTAKTDDVTRMTSEISDQKEELRAVKSQVKVLRLAVEGLTLLMDKILEQLTAKNEQDKNKTPVADTNENKNSVSNKSAEHHREQKPAIDCQEAYNRGDLIGSGYHYPYIQPRLSHQPFKVCCHVINGTSWTLIQRRVDGSVDFYRKWNDYKKGFGDVEGEFWIGNDIIHQLTSQGEYRLRVEMITWEDRSYWSEYKHFKTSSESDLYRLHVAGFSGNAGNSLSSPWENDHNGQPFSTPDRDNDNRHYDNCAEHYRGAWWFKSCFQSHLNGVYYPRGSHNNFFVRNGIQWNSIHPYSSLKDVKMMIRMNRDDELQMEFPYRLTTQQDQDQRFEVQ